MAKLNVRTRTTTEYDLVLSKKELQFIWDITQKIGGCPDRTRRGIATKIRAAIRNNIVACYGSVKDMRGDITCLNVNNY